MELSDNTIQALVTAGVGVAALAAVRVISRRLLSTYERRLAGRSPHEVARKRTIATILARVSVAAVFLIVAWSLLSIFSETQKVAQAILASGAILALVFGLAVATPLTNLGSGVLLAFTQPVRLGDRVTVGQHTGLVDEITLSYTALVTDDGGHVFVPNKDMVSTVLVNHSTRDPRRLVTVQIPITFDAPVDDARTLILRAIAGAAVEEPTIEVSDISDRAVWLELEARAPTSADVGLVSSDLRERALASLAGAGYLLWPPGSARRSP